MNEHTSFRAVNYGGIKSLLWVTEDRGAFDGPLYDWQSDHKDFLALVTKFDLVIQAGGNCGLYARLYAKYFKQVISAEPDPLNFHCLDFNCNGNKFTNIFGAFGPDTNKRTLKRHAMINCGMHRLSDQPGDVPTYRIDDLGVPTCDLIHLDVEGFEGPALRGALETIRRFRPVIILEKRSGEDVILPLGYKAYKHLRMDTVYAPYERIGWSK